MRSSKIGERYGAEQLIAQAEMLPIAIVKRQMGNLLHRARVLYFIDNDGVKEAMVKGTTSSSVQEDTGRVHATRRHESFHVMV